MAKKPSKHYASNLSSLNQEDLQKIMKYADAKYIVFINWYHIRPDKIYGIGGKSGGDSFSHHYVDFDVYTKTKQKIFLGHKFQLKNLQTPESIEHKGLRIADLQDGYKSLANYLCERLNTEVLRKDMLKRK